MIFKTKQFFGIFGFFFKKTENSEKLLKLPKEILGIKMQ